MRCRRGAPRLWVRYRTDRGPRTRAAELAQRVPQVLWPDLREQRFAADLPTSRHLEARRFLSVALVKYGAHCGWQQGAELLGLRGLSMALFNGWVRRISTAGVVEKLCTELDTVFWTLVEASDAVDFQARRLRKLRGHRRRGLAGRARPHRIG